MGVEAARELIRLRLRLLEARLGAVEQLRAELEQEARALTAAAGELRTLLEVSAREPQPAADKGPEALRGATGKLVYSAMQRFPVGVEVTTLALHGVLVDDFNYEGSAEAARRAATIVAGHGLIDAPSRGHWARKAPGEAAPGQ